jgi:mannosylglycerate hydrolase MGH1-like protein
MEAQDEVAPPWRRWGPYLSERAWGSVREDYSDNGDAWAYFPFEVADGRAFRWSDDGLAGVCDRAQTLCLALALWNGADARLKERAFGLSGPQGNHGEDVKDYWWYLDATPTASWLRWRYHYPQAAFPYQDLIDQNARRSRLDPEFELADTGIFDGNRFWIVTVEWAKAGPEDLLWRIEVVNHGPQAALLHVLPTLWFRNTWSWNPEQPRPEVRQGPEPGPALVASHATLGGRELWCSGTPEPLFCDNDTNAARLWGAGDGPAYPKDGINDHVVSGAPTVNPRRRGTKAALWHRLDVPAGGRSELRLRFRDSNLDRGSDRDRDAGGLGAGFGDLLAARRAEAEEFYASLTPDDATREESGIMRSAFAGMIWGEQFYHYDVECWLDGDPGQPPPPPGRQRGRNSGWRHLNNHDIISMPDAWEYPWYAAWDLAFHCVALAHIDARFAKEQLILLCREWYMHPNGQLPAYEWNFSDVNPPVHAWAALRVFEIDRQARHAAGDRSGPDFAFLERVFHKLLLNFTWWVNRKDTEGLNVFEGGFLGLDNIGLFDRSRPLPVAGHLEQSDGTAWMAMYCLNLLEMALALAGHDPVYADVATKFFEHFTYVATAMSTQGLWDEEDGWFYDVVHLDDGTRVPARVCSMVGVVPLFAVTIVEPEVREALPGFAERMRWFIENKPQFAECAAHVDIPGQGGRRMLSIVGPDRLRRVLNRLLDPAELLSPFGLRSLSQRHRDQPVMLDLGGEVSRIDYEPGESTTAMFGGNSNWRGPVWFPLNYLAIEALDRFHSYLGAGFTVEYPTGSGRQATLSQVADDLARRLISIFLPGPDGRRPVHGDSGLLGGDAAWRDLVWFHEYFHGDTGAGLGASHQTGWTGLVADLIADRRLGGRHGPRP